MKVINGKLFDICCDCGALVRLDKPIFGSLHICSTAEERQTHGSVIRAQYNKMKDELERA